MDAASSSVAVSLQLARAEQRLGRVERLALSAITGRRSARGALDCGRRLERGLLDLAESVERVADAVARRSARAALAESPPFGGRSCALGDAPAPEGSEAPDEVNSGGHRQPSP